MLVAGALRAPPSFMHSLLVIGCGSIGERHLRCFQQTGRCQVAACETQPDLLARIRDTYGVPAHPSLESALEAGRFDALVICTPAHLHLPLALAALERGLHLLIEKPLAVETDLVPAVRDALERSGSFLGVAYVYHHMPWVKEAGRFVREGGIGRLLQIAAVAGQHFPTFRPAYREIYYARHEHGGGAIQDALTHLVNAVERIAGPCTRVYCDAAHQCLEGVTVEDTISVSARHGEVLATYSLNQFQAPNETTVVLNGEAGSVKIELHPRRWGHLAHGAPDWTWHETGPLERDQLFIAQAHGFLDGIEGKPNDLATFEEAVQTLRFNRAALRSAALATPIALP